MFKKYTNILAFSYLCNRIKLNDMGKKGTITTSDYLPYEEYKRLVSCLTDESHYRDALYCILSFALALRVSDVRRLKWQDVIGKQKLVVQEKKTKKVKPIPIGDNVQEKIESMYVMLGAPSISEYIFRNRIDGKPVSSQYINRKMKSWKERYHLQIGNISTHTFRKTFGRYVYNKKGRTEEALILLQRVFRHTSPATTLIYIGLRDQEVGSLFTDIEI